MALLVGDVHITRLSALVLRGDRVPSVRGAGRAAEHGPEEAPALELHGTGVGGIEHALVSCSAI